jgi:phenylpyruvate tautomerase PptA (4-oxalocrotonate tautomerase family)
MPQMNVTLIGSPISDEQRVSLHSSITDLLVDVLDKSRMLVVVSISVRSERNWSVGGNINDDLGVTGVQAEIRMADSNTSEQKEAFAAACQKLFARAFPFQRMPFYLTFQEIPATNWAYNGRMICPPSATTSP